MKKGYLKTYAKIGLILIVLTLIILGAVYFFKNEYDDEQYETIKTDMLLIEGKTKIIAEKVRIKEKDAEYLGKKIEEVKEDETIKSLQEKQVINIEEKDSIYYILEKSNLEELGLTTIKLEEGYYIVEYNSNEIIYPKGVKNKEGNIIYKLSDMESKVE